MAKILEVNELKVFLKRNHISQEKFSEEVNYSLSALKDILSGKTKLDSKKQIAFSDAAIRLAETKDNIIDRLRVFDLKTNREFARIVFDDVAEWIRSEDVERLSEYWNNFDSVYRLIDKEAAIFLIRCKNLVSINSTADLRAELLSYLQSFVCSVASVQKALSTICIILNWQNSFKKNKANHKKRKQLSQEEYREKLIKEFSRSLYEDDDPEKGELVYSHSRCVTEMDDMDWELLIAYILIKTDDKNGEKINQVKIKLQNLVEQAN